MAQTRDMRSSVDHGEVERLRQTHYNATVLSLRRCHDELMILRVRPDGGVPRAAAGQYTLLGLGYWEPRVAGCQAEEATVHLRHRLIKRAYSISCPMLDEWDRVVGIDDLPFFEFYVSLIRRAERPPALTPRLFALRETDRIFCGRHALGHYSLPDLPATANVVFAATGTGEAPHNAMVAQLLKSGHTGQIVHVTCVRWRRDLAYLETHRRLEALFANYRYIALTTREPQNVDPSRPDYVGKRYLQDFFESHDLTAQTGLSLDPRNTHVFLCGHPDMIGLPLRPNDRSRRESKPKGMVPTLENLGFRLDRPHEPGSIHVERYW